MNHRRKGPRFVASGAPRSGWWTVTDQRLGRVVAICDTQQKAEREALAFNRQAAFDGALESAVVVGTGWVSIDPVTGEATHHE